MADDLSLHWWVIDGQSLLNTLQKCADGEDPDMMYLELVANSALPNEVDDEDRW